MAKTLLDLYQSASKAAAEAIDITDPMDLIQAKTNAFKADSIDKADGVQWLEYFDGQLERFRNLRKTSAPSAPKVTA